VTEAEAKLKDNDGNKAKAKLKDGEIHNSGKRPETDMFTGFVAFVMMRPYVPEGFDSNRQLHSCSLTVM
jgi:hypothetical protein